ncbi:hypothetical protein HAX54_022565, partial [Datura stramonium]|nr:hypothetical protein [Datura stramonium]
MKNYHKEPIASATRPANCEGSAQTAVPRRCIAKSKYQLPSIDKAAESSSCSQTSQMQHGIQVVAGKPTTYWTDVPSAFSVGESTVKECCKKSLWELSTFNNGGLRGCVVEKENVSVVRMLVKEGRGFIGGK